MGTTTYRVIQTIQGRTTDAEPVDVTWATTDSLATAMQSTVMALGDKARDPFYRVLQVRVDITEA